MQEQKRQTVVDEHFPEMLTEAEIAVDGWMDSYTLQGVKWNSEEKEVEDVLDKISVDEKIDAILVSGHPSLNEATLHLEGGHVYDPSLGGVRNIYFSDGTAYFFGKFREMFGKSMPWIDFRDGQMLTVEKEGYMPTNKKLNYLRGTDSSRLPATLLCLATAKDMKYQEIGS